MLRGARPLALLLSAVPFFSRAHDAHAGTSLQALLGASVGVTDNVASAPSNPPPGTAGPEADALFTITPGLALTTGTPRAVQRITYLFNGIFYARHTEADTYTNSLTWLGFFLPTKKIILGTNFAIGEGRQSTFNNAAASTSPTLIVQPAAILDLLTVNAGETMAWELTRRLRLVESLGFSESWYIDHLPLQGITQTIPGRAGLEYYFAHDVIGASLDVSYTNFLAQLGPVTEADGSVDPNGVVSPEQQQLALTPLAHWRRDFSYFINVRADLGAVVVFDPSNVQNKTIEPAGGAGINFSSRLARFDLSYTHGITTSLLLRANYLTDTVAFRATVLFADHSRWSGSAGAGYSYDRQLDLTTTAVQATGHAITGDISLNFAPWKFLYFYLRYQGTGQIGHPSDPLPIPTTHRDTVLFGFTAIYPEAAAADVPSSVLGVRADGRDDGAITTSKSSNP
jgi:hypothetical protein